MPRESYIPSPSDTDYHSDLLHFVSEAVQESDNFLRAQPNYDKIAKAKRAIHSSRTDSLSSGLSDTEANHVAKAAVQLTASLTDVRPFWEYRTFNPNFKKQTEILGKIALHLWLQLFWDMRHADMIRGCCTGATSYAHLSWNDQLKDLDFNAEDVRDVLPFRPNDYHTIQTAEGVILRRERTVNYLKARYPEYADFIQPDRDGSGRSTDDTRFNRLMERLGSPFHQRLFGGKKPSKEIPKLPTADEYTFYLTDRRIHKGKDPLYMGDWHTAPEPDCSDCLTLGTPHALNNWSYIVQRGEPVYPNKRLIICIPGSKIIPYDNTSIYWHGLYPFPKLTLEPWDDTYIGKGLIWDVLPMQKLLNRWLQVIDNHLQKWQQPDLFTDKNSTAQSEFNKINTARPGLKVRFNPVAGKGPELRYPDPLPQYLVDFGNWCIEQIGTLSGAHDLSNLTKLNQLPAADSIERILDAMTPEVRLRSRILEAFTREFATITAFNIAQFKTINERMAILGPDGVTQEDFDYDPGSFLPDYVHASDFDEQGIPTAIAMARGPLPRYNRAKEVMRQISMHIAPGSLLSASEITDKLMYLTLWREGGMDLITMLDKMGVPNVETIIKRLAEQASAGIGPQARQGRQPTGQQMPQASARSDGSGVKVSESG
jgi:hypothetical protein